MLKQATLEAILGRPLTPREVTNISLYLKTAQENLETLLCSPLYEETEVRFFNARIGYRTVFTDIFTAVNSVKINGVVVDPSRYYVAQFDNRNSKINSSIVFRDASFVSRPLEIEIDADWGVCQNKMPRDLQSVLAQLFAFASKRKTNSAGVKSKKNEDFTITFTDETPEEVFMRDNARVISKYSLCDIGYVRHGDVSCLPLSQRENWLRRWNPLLWR